MGLSEGIGFVEARPLGCATFGCFVPAYPCWELSIQALYVMGDLLTGLPRCPYTQWLLPVMDPQMSEAAVGHAVRVCQVSLCRVGWLAGQMTLAP